MKGVNSLSFLLALTIVLGCKARSSVNNTEGTEDRRLIKTSESEPASWLTQQQIYSLIQNNIGFIDITHRGYPLLDRNKTPIKKEFPTTLRYGSIVNEAFDKLSTARIESFINDFSSFHNRHYRSDAGFEATVWLLSQLNESIENSDYTGNVTTQTFQHDWRQPSIIIRFEGTDPSLRHEVVVLGAHLDSIVVGGNSSLNLAPGADDNASGSAVLFETTNAILEMNFIPKRTIELQWYAAEEIGLFGSQDIAEKYNSQGVNVISMLNFDVVGYFVEGRNEISFRTDYTDDALNAFLRTVVEGYLSVPWANAVCGYGCSDHASWTAFGFPAAAPSEFVKSPYMHTVRDTIDTVSFEQVKEFAKLATAYSIELAEPSD